MQPPAGCAGFELYRAFPDDERRFAEFKRRKLLMPVLALAGDKSNGIVELKMAQERGATYVAAWHPTQDTGCQMRILRSCASNSLRSSGSGSVER
jgi:hypothetical protein